MSKKYVLPLIVIFGLFYLFSGIIKIIDIDNFLFLIRSYNIKILVYFAPAVPIIEIIIGLMLVLQIRTKHVMLVSIALLVFFTIFFSLSHFILDIDDCGCFGGIDFLKMSPAIFYLRNGILILLSIYLYNSLQFEKKKIKSLKYLTIGVVVIIVSIIVGNRSMLKLYLLDSPYNRANINEYHDSFIGKNINETILSKYLITSKDSSYLVFIYSYKCPHCLLSSINLKEYVNNNVVDNIIGLTKGTRSERRFFEENIDPNFNYKQLRFIEINEITGFYPLSFYVKNDTIQFKVRGALPKFNEFSEKYL